MDSERTGGEEDSAQDDLELAALTQSWSDCKIFLQQVKIRQSTEMPERVRELIESIKSEMVHQMAELTGATPKREEKGRMKREVREESDEDEEDENPASWLKILARKLDNRTVPKLEKFSEESGLELVQYIERFEEYYREKL